MGRPNRSWTRAELEDFSKVLMSPRIQALQVIGEGSEDRLYAVLIFEPVLHHFELELADGGKDQIPFPSRTT